MGLYDRFITEETMPMDVTLDMVMQRTEESSSVPDDMVVAIGDDSIGLIHSTNAQISLSGGGG